MIGTQNSKGSGNIGLFNSLVHIGANPPLLGFILRPTTVARHTYENILETNHYTINHGRVDDIEKAHQTSAKYEEEQDEFEETGFEKRFIDGFKAPFIKGASIALGLEFREEHLIKANDTRLIVGEVQHVLIDDKFVGEDGFIDTAEAQSLLTSGLDAYHSHELVKRMPYARP